MPCSNQRHESVPRLCLAQLVFNVTVHIVHLCTETSWHLYTYISIRGIAVQNG